VTSRIALTEEHYAQLVAALEDDHELAGVLSVRVVSEGGLTLLGRTLTWAPLDTYLNRSSCGLGLSSSGWVPAVRGAARAGEGVVFVHTHPGGIARFSSHDDVVDGELAAATLALGAAAPYAALVVAGTPREPVLAARVYRNGVAEPVTAVRVTGGRLQLLVAPDSPDASIGYGGDAAGPAETFDRQARLLGAAGQRTLSALEVGVIGAGGTGSAVAEQLARLGVGVITIVDDDVVTPPTPTRGYGMTTADLGRPKAEVLAAHLNRIGLGSRIRPVVAGVQSPAGLAALRHADVVFACVDGHGGRLILNRWAWAHLAPVVDLAVLVSAGEEVAIDSRVTWLAPGSACLLCRGRIDPALAYAENLDPEKRRALAGEGYVAAADTPQPAVVTLTTMVAALATTELILRLFGFGDASASELIALPVQRELRRNALPPRPGCFCSDTKFLGRGPEAPYLDLMWPE